MQYFEDILNIYVCVFANMYNLGNRSVSYCFLHRLKYLITAQFRHSRRFAVSGKVLTAAVSVPTASYWLPAAMSPSSSCSM